MEDSHYNIGLAVRPACLIETVWFGSGFPHSLRQWLGCAMALVITGWPLTTEVWVHASVSPCGVCGGQSGTVTGYSLSSSVFPCQYYSTMALHFHISSARWTVGLSEAAVQRHSLTSSTWTTVRQCLWTHITASSCILPVHVISHSPYVTFIVNTVLFTQETSEKD
jgi:hypothetical protein